MAPVTVGILGPLELSVAGRSVVITGPKQRALLAMSASDANRPVTVGALVDAVWGDPVPDGAEHTLQQHVSAIRKLLEPGRGSATAATILLTRSPGYELRVESLDADEFERSAAAGFGRGERSLAGRDGRPRGRARMSARSGALDVRDSPKLSAAAVRLDDQRLTVLEALFDARLESGQAGAVVAEIEQLVVEHPFRERLRGQLMLALYRSGRQADALAAYRTARQVLIDELGIEPGAALRDLEQAILLQSPSSTGRGRSHSESCTRRSEPAPVRCRRVELPDGQAVLLAEGRP